MNLSYLVLGLVQGLTEFLPVSSSGHLAVLSSILPGITELSSSDKLVISVFYHFATLIAVCLYFRVQILSYWKALMSRLKGQETEEFGEIVKIIILTVPTGIIGLGLKKAGIEEIPIHGVLLALCVTGALVFSVDSLKEGKVKMGLKEALILGLAQGIAVVPGISRSGSTIFTGVALGISREKMASLSFLMSIPAILAATLLETIELSQAGIGGIDISSLLFGGLIALVSGYLSLVALIPLLKRKWFRIFGIYCFAMAAWAYFR
jgi:undecaprenyl-diphosphatase